AAIAMAANFYMSLADGYPIDAAMSEARKAIYGLGNNIEFGTPVLYMRAPDGRIFNVAGKDGGMTEEEKEAASAPKTEVHGDVVGGDAISIGNISGSQGIAIGRGSSAVVNTGPANPTGRLTPFDRVRGMLGGYDDDAREEAEFALKKLEDICAEPDPDTKKLDRWLATLTDVSPDLTSQLISAIKNSGSDYTIALRGKLDAWAADNL
ncbi:MAG: hypothetical protein GYB68_10135, partial [Chloroflexi bacterium]|nr:hypothetical protein [Chloroflexota bacterium]